MGRRLAIAAVVLIVVAQVAFYFTRTVDDMFIFLRYAENLAAGDGLVFNTGQRVEGYSSVTWLAALTVGGVLGANLVTWSKLLAVASLAALLVGQHRFLVERLGVGRGPEAWRPLVPWLGLAATACCSYVIAWTMLGLETPLYLALLVWTAVTLGRYLERPSRRTFAAAGVVGAAFALSRPEAPMFLAAITAGLLVNREPERLLVRARRLALGVAPAAGAFLAYAVFRRLYFGLWLPHTYYSKRGDGWHRDGLRGLFGQGADQEVALIAIGLVLAAWAVWRRRDGVILGVVAATVVFVARVEIDWMPNVRYWLPIWITLPMIVVWGIDRAPRFAPALCVVLGCVMAQQLAIDTRYSIFSYRGRGSKTWYLPKTQLAMREAWQNLTNEPTAEVLTKLGPFDHGQTTQVYRVIESDARPLESTWYIGPDIGLVGYLTPVQVWEPPGLFTPDIIKYGRELKGKPARLAPELLRAALARPVVMTELYDSMWTDAVSKDPVLSQRYEPVKGWHWFRERGAARPERAQVQERYRRALAKLPSSYDITTQYGRPLGAAVEKRVRAFEAGAGP